MEKSIKWPVEGMHRDSVMSNSPQQLARTPGSYNDDGINHTRCSLQPQAISRDMAHCERNCGHVKGRGGVCSPSAHDV